MGWYCGLKIVGTYGGAYGGPCCGAVRWGGIVGGDEKKMSLGQKIVLTVC